MTEQLPPPPTAGPGPRDPQDPGSDGPRVSREQMRDVGRLRRPTDDRMVAGVCAGLARHFDVDPIIVRVAMVVLAFFGGAGLLLYVAGWVIVPEEGAASAPLGLDDRNRGIALVGVAVLAALAMLGDWSGAYWFPWPIVLLALAVFLLLNRSRRGPAHYVPPTQGAPGTVAYAAPTAYAGQPAPTGPWTGPVPPPLPVAPRPARKPGPILFGFVLALIALGIGVLGTVDLAGVAVADAAYPALALGITGLALVLGAFWGRGGGLIALGLVAALATAATSAVGHVDTEQANYRPSSAQQVLSSYEMDRGELVLDLRGVSDLDELDGRELRLDVAVGRIEVVVPHGLDVEADAVVHGPGSIQLFDREDGGIDFARSASHDGGVGVPDLTLVTEMNVGEIVVREQGRN